MPKYPDNSGWKLLLVRLLKLLVPTLILRAILFVIRNTYF